MHEPYGTKGKPPTQRNLLFIHKKENKYELLILIFGALQWIINEIVDLAQRAKGSFSL